MANARTIRRQQPERSARPRVTGVSEAGTELDLGGGDDLRVLVDGQPDRARATQVVRSFDRVLWQRLQVEDGRVRGVVAGTRHRRPVQLAVSGDAALGLLETGVPTVARRAGTAS